MPSLVDSARDLLAWLQRGGADGRAAAELLSQTGAEALTRKHFSPGHFTASAWVVDGHRKSVLLVHHNRLRRWLQPGGHIEATDRSLLEAAEREAREETGVGQLLPLSQQPFDFDRHAIPATSAEPAHDHFDVRYAFALDPTAQAPSPGPLQHQPEEVGAARWVPFHEVQALTREASVLGSVQRLAAVL